MIAVFLSCIWYVAEQFKECRHERDATAKLAVTYLDTMEQSAACLKSTIKDAIDNIYNLPSEELVDILIASMVQQADHLRFQSEAQKVILKSIFGDAIVLGRDDDVSDD